MSALQKQWQLLSAVALASSLAHVLIDFHIGLFGASSQTMSGAEALAVCATALAYGGWAYALASANDRDRTSLLSLFVYAVFWSFLANGFVALLIVPPPSAAFPYQDIAHISNVVLGGLAGLAVWRAHQAAPGTVRWAGPGLHSALLLAAYIGQNAVYFTK